MSPFRKKGRSAYYLWPTLPGFGRVGPWSTGLRTKALAESMESWLKDVATSDPEVVRGIIEGKYSLREAYQAHKEKRLAALKERGRDPLLRDVVNRYRSVVRDRRQLDGLELLDQLAPAGARFSWLTVPKHITDLCTTAVSRGQKVNSIHRSLYAAVKGVLTYEVGKAKKQQITADVQFAHEDDSRSVDVTADQLRALLDACDEEMRDLAAAAAMTGIDRGPLLALTPAHVDWEAGQVRVPDRKNAARDRMLPLPSGALALFRRLAAGKADTDRLFSISESSAAQRWQAVKRATGLDVRFKDLRHVFANAWVDEGGTLASLKEAMGHTSSRTTLKYTKRQARTDHARMDQVVARLGLARDHLRIEKGGA